MTLKGLENEIAKDWIKEQKVEWRFRNTNSRLSVKSKPEYVYVHSLFEWELTKCQDLNLLTKEQADNLMAMLASKSETDIDLGRRLLANFRKQRLKL